MNHERRSFLKRVASAIPGVFAAPFAAKVIKDSEPAFGLPAGAIPLSPATIGYMPVSIEYDCERNLQIVRYCNLLNAGVIPLPQLRAYEAVRFERVDLPDPWEGL